MFIKHSDNVLMSPLLFLRLLFILFNTEKDLSVVPVFDPNVNINMQKNFVSEKISERSSLSIIFKILYTVLFLNVKFL